MCKYPHKTHAICLPPLNMVWRCKKRKMRERKKRKNIENKNHIDAWKNNAKIQRKMKKIRQTELFIWNNEEREFETALMFIMRWCVVVYAMIIMSSPYRTIKIEYWLRACTQQYTLCQSKNKATQRKANKHKVKWNEDSQQPKEMYENKSTTKMKKESCLQPEWYVETKMGEE